MGVVVGLTQPQIKRLADLPDDHRVIGERDRSPVIESSAGDRLLLRPSGRMVLDGRVAGSQPYLSVDRC